MAKTVLKTLETSCKFVYLQLIICRIIKHLFNLLNVILYIIISLLSPTLHIFVNCSHLEVSQNLFTFVKLKL